MAIDTREELVETLSSVGVMGAARLGAFDNLIGESSGGYTLPAATTSTIGGVKKAANITDVPAQTVTTIEQAQTSITALTAKINALLAAQRTAGMM